VGGSGLLGEPQCGTFSLTGNFYVLFSKKVPRSFLELVKSPADVTAVADADG
jgi:hypothetical protein